MSTVRAPRAVQVHDAHVVAFHLKHKDGTPARHHLDVILSRKVILSVLVGKHFADNVGAVEQTNNIFGADTDANTEPQSASRQWWNRPFRVPPGDPVPFLSYVVVVQDFFVA